MNDHIIQRMSAKAADLRENLTAEDVDFRALNLLEVVEEFLATTEQPAATCRHCGRLIVFEDGGWIDPEATGDDSIWRHTCDSHDTFTAEHEPEETS